MIMKVCFLNEKAINLLNPSFSTIKGSHTTRLKMWSKEFDNCFVVYSTTLLDVVQNPAPIILLI